MPDVADPPARHTARRPTGEARPPAGEARPPAREARPPTREARPPARDARPGPPATARLAVALVVTAAVHDLGPVHVLAASLTSYLAGGHLWRRRRWLLGIARRLPRGRLRAATVVDFVLAAALAVLFPLTVCSGLALLFDVPGAAGLHLPVATAFLVLGLGHGVRLRRRAVRRGRATLAR